MSVASIAISLAVIGIGCSLARSFLSRPSSVRHTYFTRLWMMPRGEYTRWEAELDCDMPHIRKTLGVHSAEEAGAADCPPTEAEVQFCREILMNVPALIQRCSSLLAQEGASSNCLLEGFSVPKDGDPSAAWSLMLWNDDTGCSYSFQIRGDSVILETVER